jgi:hypothetical protein
MFNRLITPDGGTIESGICRKAGGVVVYCMLLKIFSIPAIFIPMREIYPIQRQRSEKVWNNFQPPSTNYC